VTEPWRPPFIAGLPVPTEEPKPPCAVCEMQRGPFPTLGYQARVLTLVAQSVARGALRHRGSVRDHAAPTPTGAREYDCDACGWIWVVEPRNEAHAGGVSRRARTA
jgi:hypothetical protein